MGWSAMGKTLLPVLCGQDEMPWVLEQALPGWRWFWTQRGPPLAADMSVTGLEAELEGVPGQALFSSLGQGQGPLLPELHLRHS